MAEQVLLAVSTFPDRGTAQRIAEELVAGHYAACANVASAVDSFYWWKGELESATEVMVFFKTTTRRFPDFQKRLRSLHPYGTPEIISFEITRGLPEYLAWVVENCTGAEPAE